MNNKELKMPNVYKSLIGSVAINLFLFGMVVAPMLKPPLPPLPPPPQMRGYIIQQIISSLSPEDSKLMKEIKTAENERNFNIRKSVDKAMESIHDIMNSEKIDPAVLKAALEELKKADIERAETMATSVMAIATKVSTDGRMKLNKIAEMNAPRPPEGPQPPRDDRGPPPDFDHPPMEGPPPGER